MDVISQLPGQVMELVSSFVSSPVAGQLTVLGLSQYTCWMLVACAVLIAVMLRFKKAQAASLVPHGVFVNGVEYVVEFVRDDIMKGVLGPTWKQHFPFIATVFFFVLVNNLFGLIPGAKPGTGTIAVTVSVALCSFVYFIYVGVRKKGGLGYIKSLAPAGVPFPMNVFAWVIEVFSTFLRLITLAVRLFCNMFAGHVVMGTFAIMSSMFFGQLSQGLSAATAIDGGASLLWVLILIVIYAVEMLVAVVQAYVFALLSAVYVQLAEQEE